MTVEELIRRCDNISTDRECTIILQRKRCKSVEKQEFKSFNDFAITAIEAELIGTKVTSFTCLPGAIYINVY